MKLLQCQSPGEVTAGILGRAGAEALTCIGNVLQARLNEGRRGEATRLERRDSMLLGLAETLVQIRPCPHIMAVIQDDSIKRARWLY